MKLYGYWRSTSTWRVRIGLQLKRLDYEYAPVNLLEGAQHRDEYRAINPGATVPLLEIEEGGRTVRLAQSMAILEYLDDRHPQPPFLPEHPYLKARTRMLAECVNSGIQPLQNLSVLQYVDTALKGDKKAWAQHWIDLGLRALQGLAQETAGSFLVGEQPTLADIYLVPQLAGARRFGVDLAPFGLLLRVEEACNRMPAFQAAHADNQPDAVRH